MLALVLSAATASEPCLDAVGIVARRRPLADDQSPSSDWWNEGAPADAERGIDAKLESAIALPDLERSRAKSFALVLTCRAAGSDRDAAPDRELAVRIRRADKKTEVLEAVVIGDRTQELRAILPSIADIDGDGRGELCLRGSMIDRQTGVEGEADWFVFFGGGSANAASPRTPAPDCARPKPGTVDPAVLRVVRRARHATAPELYGVSARIRAESDGRAPSPAMIVEEVRHAAKDEAALDAWWSDSSGVDVLEKPTRVRRFRWSTKSRRLEELCSATNAGSPAVQGSASTSSTAGQRTLLETGDGELSVVEHGHVLRALRFPGSIVRIIRNANLLYAAVYVVPNDGDTTHDLFLVDLSTSSMRRFPRSESGEIVSWAWSPDGSYAVSVIDLAGPLIVHSVNDVERWIGGGIMSKLEISAPDTARSQVAMSHRFVRWTSNDSFELAVSALGSATHYRYDIGVRRLVRLYSRDDTVL